MTYDNIIKLSDAAKVEEAASLWIMRLDEGEADAALLSAFKSWYHKNDQHKQAFDRLSGVWDGMDVLTEFIDLAASEDAARALHDSRSFPFQGLFSKQAAVGVAASIVALIGLGSLSYFALTPASFSSAYETAVGQQETVLLPDGSKVILNTDSILSVDFSKSARAIKLSRGEAFFEVEKDKKRPFSVETNAGRVTALGTAFGVRVHPNKINVVVTEGRVAMAPTIAASANDAEVAQQPVTRLMEVTAGQAVEFAQQVEEIHKISSQAIEHQLDWRDGVLAFRGESLEQVVFKIGRYTDLVIEIEGDDLRKQPIGGYFKIGEMDALLDAISIMNDVNVERIDENRVRISRVL